MASTVAMAAPSTATRFLRRAFVRIDLDVPCFSLAVLR